MWKRAVPWIFVAGLSLGLVLLAIQTSATAKPDTPSGKAEEGGKEVKEAKGAELKGPGIKVASSRVSAVTVYPNSALVTREVDVPDAPGIHELVVTPLPVAVQNTSLYTEGSEGIRVLTTRFRTRAIEGDTRDDVRNLLEEIDALQLAKEKIEADIKTNQTNNLLLNKMEGFATVTTIQTTEKANLNSESAIATTKFIMEARAEKAKEMVGLQQQLQANQKKADFLQRKIQELTGSPVRTERDAIIVVEKPNAGAGKVRLNYLVNNSSWSPQYKIRAGKASKDPLRVEYLAGITQQTGEDWTNVKLVLSTAQPALNASPPDLQSLQVTAAPKETSPGGLMLDAMQVEDQIKGLRSKAQKDFNDRKVQSGAGLVNTAAALDQSWEILHPEAAMQRGCAMAVREGPTVTYHLSTKFSVPSRNDEQVLEVTQLDLTPNFYYKAVPLLTQHVYRMAEVVNKSKQVLLPGEATMYIDADFVGRISLPLVAIGEQFTLGFGIDPQLQVQRQMVDRMRTTQGANQALRYDYRILVNNFKTEKVKLQVWDRLPMAENEAVGVSLLKSTPELSTDAIYAREQKPMNLLRWDVDLDANKHGEQAQAITYQFRLELDRKMTITGIKSAGIFGSGGGAVNPSPSLANVSPADLEQIKMEMAKLSPEDRKLATAQVFCAIDTDSPLGTMGPIYKVMVKGQPIFLCCKGCVAEAQSHPDQTLVKFQQLMNKLNKR